MPEQLSVFELVANASLLVQLVMASLLLASVFSWVMIFQRWFYLRRVQNSVDEFEEYFWSGIDLRAFYTELEGHDELTGIEGMFVAGFKEYTRLSEQSGAEPESIMQGVQRVMRVALNREEEKLEKHLAFLATVGSTSPYVGLFGTVWGIMNSFQSIAISKNTSLAVVAPGIAEALFATALGLLAAIPAVVAYNKLSRDLDRYAGRLETFAGEFAAILSREMEGDN